MFFRKRREFPKARDGSFPPVPPPLPHPELISSASCRPRWDAQRFCLVSVIKETDKAGIGSLSENAVRFRRGHRGLSVSEDDGCVRASVCVCARAGGRGPRLSERAAEERRDRANVSGASARPGSSAGVTRLPAACKQHEFIWKEGEGGGGGGVEGDSQGRMTDTNDGDKDRSKICQEQKKKYGLRNAPPAPRLGFCVCECVSV